MNYIFTDITAILFMLMNSLKLNWKMSFCKTVRISLQDNLADECIFWKPANISNKNPTYRKTYKLVQMISYWSKIEVRAMCERNCKSANFRTLCNSDVLPSMYRFNITRRQKCLYKPLDVHLNGHFNVRIIVVFVKIIRLRVCWKYKI